MGRSSLGLAALLLVAFLTAACDGGEVDDLLQLDVIIDDLAFALDRDNFQSTLAHQDEIERITFNHPGGFWYDSLFRDTRAYHVRFYQLEPGQDGEPHYLTVEFGRTPVSSNDEGPSLIEATFEVREIDGRWQADLEALVRQLSKRPE